MLSNKAKKGASPIRLFSITPSSAVSSANTLSASLRRKYKMISTVDIKPVHLSSLSPIPCDLIPLSTISKTYPLESSLIEENKKITLNKRINKMDTVAKKTNDKNVTLATKNNSKNKKKVNLKDNTKNTQINSCKRNKKAKNNSTKTVADKDDKTKPKKRKIETVQIDKKLVGNKKKKSQLTLAYKNALERFTNEDTSKSYQVDRFNNENLIHNWSSLYLSGCCTQGAREYMEDRFIIETDLYDNDVTDPDSIKKNVVNPIFSAIYDGHNGSWAAEYAAKHLHLLLKKSNELKDIIDDLNNNDKRENTKLSTPEINTIKKVIEKSFFEIEQEILHYTMENNKLDGSTVVMTLLIGNHLFIANTGDSRAVLGKYDNTYNIIGERLSVDHKPDLLSEKQRIINAGGNVIFSGCWRVSCKKVSLRLAVSRSLGDHLLKKNLPSFIKKELVSAEPFVKCIEINKSKDKFIILASDGVWDRIQDNEAVQIVDDMLTNHNSNDMNIATKDASKELIKISLDRKSYDNITSLIIAFQ